LDLESVEIAMRSALHRAGADWIWNLIAEHFPGAIQIVDL
jgi:hypothetical protein